MGIEIGEGIDVVMQPVFKRPARAEFLGELIKFRSGWYALRDRDGRYQSFKLRRDAIAWLQSSR